MLIATVHESLIAKKRHHMPPKNWITYASLGALLDGEKLGESHRRSQANGCTPSDETRPGTGHESNR
jgi:hypothetical protein